MLHAMLNVRHFIAAYHIMKTLSYWFEYQSFFSLNTRVSHFVVVLVPSEFSTQIDIFSFNPHPPAKLRSLGHSDFNSHACMTNSWRHFPWFSRSLFSRIDKKFNSFTNYSLLLYFPFHLRSFFFLNQFVSIFFFLHFGFLACIF